MTIRPSLSALLLLFIAGLPASEVRMTTLHTAGAGGYVGYRIPVIAATAGGTLLTVCEARRDGFGDWAAIDLLMRRSSDDGVTWSEPVALARAGDPGTSLAHNAVLIPSGGRVVHLLYCTGYDRCFHRRSDDDGATFAPAVEITAAFAALKPQYAWNVIATGPGHGTRLRSGRLVVPCWLSTGGKKHRPSVVTSLISDDDGKTWSCGGILPQTVANPSETVAVELGDGRVLFNLRNEAPDNRRRIATSPDGATGWSPLTSDDALLEPVCMAALIRLDEGDGKGRIAFANPDCLTFKDGKPGVSRERRNLTIRLSADEAKTWSHARVLEPGAAGYCDLAAAPGGVIWCFYECGALKGNIYHTNELRVARLTTAWVEAGQRAPLLPADEKP
jgi:sialidase-1